MNDPTSRTTAVFAHPFTVPGFDETLPAGAYELETDLSVPSAHLAPEAWMAQVRITLHPRLSHPGLTRSLTVSLADLDRVRAKDRLSGRDLSECFLDEMLSDPMIRLVMQADGVSEAQLRHLYGGARRARTDAAPGAGESPPRDHAAHAG